MFFTIYKSQAQTSTPTVTPQTTSSKFKGLPIGRTDLIEGISAGDSLIHFKEVKVAKGLPKFIAKGSYGARIEITGTEENITKAQWTVSQPANGTLSKISFTRMAYFVNLLLNQEGVKWFFQQTFAYNQTPIAAIDNITIISGFKAAFVYDPLKKNFMVTVSTE